MQPTQQVAAPVVPVVDVAKEAELEAIRQVELEAKFKRGEMSTADYLEQSGAMSAYLAKQGIPVESLKATVERNADAVETQSWADAVEAFKQSPSGASWPGGDKTVMVMNDKIFALGLQDATDKVAALAQAYAAMQSSGTVFPGEAAAAAVTPVVAAPVASAAAAAVAAPAAVVPVVRTASQSSTLFGTSSGANEGVSTIAPKGDVKIDPLASPQEILEQWKRANVAAGKDPNAAFVETYSAKRA